MIHRLSIQPVGERPVMMIGVVLPNVPYFVANARHEDGLSVLNAEQLPLMSV